MSDVYITTSDEPALVAQSDARPTCNPFGSGNIDYAESNQEIFSTLIFSLPLIQEVCQLLAKESAQLLVNH